MIVKLQACCHDKTWVCVCDDHTASISARQPAYVHLVGTFDSCDTDMHLLKQTIYSVADLKWAHSGGPMDSVRLSITHQFVANNCCGTQQYDTGAGSAGHQ